MVLMICTVFVKLEQRDSMTRALARLNSFTLTLSHPGGNILCLVVWPFAVHVSKTTNTGERDDGGSTSIQDWEENFRIWVIFKYLF